MRNRRRVVKQSAIVLCLILLFTNINITTVKAADANYIRVGLKSLYHEVSGITIYNKKIGIGYCIDSGYQVDDVLTSSNGFTFSAFKEYCILVKEEFRYFKSAKEAATTISRLGVDAYPVKTDREKWMIMIGAGQSEASAKETYNKVKGRFGYTYGQIQKDNKHRILVKTEQYSFLMDGKIKNAYPQFEVVGGKNAKDCTIDLGKRRYRGRIEIGRYGKNTLTAVNTLNLEHYLYGVVPSEMPSTWPIEALKVQAVCARGYAIKTTGYSSMSNIEKAFTLGDTASNQAYKGFIAETNNSNQAVNETAGKVLCYNGDIVTTYYFSTSGGSTEASEDVWTSSKPYLKSVSDIYETSPAKKPWLIKYTASELKSILTRNDFMIDSVENVVSEVKTASGRTYSLRINGKDQYVTLQKSAIRSILSMPSSKFKVITYQDQPDLVSVKSSKKTTTTKIGGSYVLSANGGTKKASSSMEQYIVKSSANMSNYPAAAPTSKDTYYFAGMGFGHGIGMSQSGARGMAEAGFTYDEILKHYYTGTTIVQK